MEGGDAAISLLRPDARPAVPPGRMGPLTVDMERLRTLAREAVTAKIRELEEQAPGGRGTLPDGFLKEKVRPVVEALIQQQYPTMLILQRQTLTDQLLQDMLGLGPLEPLLQDPEVTEIMVKTCREIWVERGGSLVRTEATFRDDRQVRDVLQKIVAPIGRRVDDARPMVDARLPDGSRVNGVLYPVAVDGTTITIRKFRQLPGVQNLVRLGTLTPELCDFLAGAVRGRLNIVVSGSTGSGKTTLLNVLSQFIPPGERIITVENPVELQLRQEHVVRLEARPPNIEGVGEISIRDLVQNALRMRPDRIVVGEVRGGEALDMLQAMNTGHDGSLTTCHANDAQAAVHRLVTMAQMAGQPLPHRALLEQVAAAIHLIIHVERRPGGTRCVAQVAEVRALDSRQTGHLITHDLFRLVRHGDTWCLERTGGLSQRTLEHLQQYGVDGSRWSP